MVGVRWLSASVWLFADSAGVEAADELAKATGVCATVRPRREESPLVNALQDRTERTGLGGGHAEVFSPADCLLLRWEAERIARCSRHSNLDWASFNLLKCILFMRIKSLIVPAVRQ